MIDVEVLRIEKLVEERETYENGFFSMEPKLKIDDFNIDISQYFPKFDVGEFDFEEELCEPLKDYFNELRDEKLIDERQNYEIEYFKYSNVDIIEKDLLDIIIESYEEPDLSDIDFENYKDYSDEDFESYDDDCFEYYYVEEPEYMNRPRCAYDLDYMPNDNIFDYDNCYDYPESPKENIEGIIYTF